MFFKIGVCFLKMGVGQVVSTPSSRAVHVGVKEAVSPIFSVILNNQTPYLYGCKRQNNGSVLLTITLPVHRN